jgi:dissimilatory sulfite reductase (desulfoviridin) alpha/beta subunit
MTHGNARTFPYLGQPICFVPAGAVVGAAEAVVRLFRDHGNRADRKRARIKYVVHDWGVPKFREVLAGYLGAMPQEPRPVTVSGFQTHLGWHAQGDGKFYYGLSVENGRVKDEGSLRLRTALRKIIERFQPDLRITALQDILLCDLDAGARVEIDQILAEHGVPRPEQVSTVRQHSMSCPAIPTCGLALSESERTLPGILDQLEVELKRLGLENERLGVRMTGCPNGCARPYQSEIGIVGRSGDKYTLFVGGDLLGHRLSFPLRDLVPLADIVPTLVPVLARFKTDRQPRERFGDFCHRLGAEQLQALLPTPKARHAAPPREEANGSNGAGHGPSNGAPQATAKSEPATLAVAVAEPRVSGVSAVVPAPVRSETILAGLAGEERPDYTLRLHTDESVKETVVYFYTDDRRAAAAQPGDALVREAVYLGRVDPYRLHAARKLSDTFYVGTAGRELRDRRIEYRPDGAVAGTVVFYYEGDLRAKDAPSGAAVRREVGFAGAVS